MCLSTPIISSSEDSTSTKSAICTSTTSLNNNKNNNNNTCTLNTVGWRDHDENTNKSSIRNRICDRQTQKPCTFVCNRVTVASEKSGQSKDLADNLGFNEENAVYKEIPHALDSNQSIQAKTLSSSESEYNPQIRWLDLIAQIFLHGGALYGVYLLFLANLYTFLWGKSVSSGMIKRRAAKCGDGSRFLTDEFAHREQVWGYGDQDIQKEDDIELAKMK